MNRGFKRRGTEFRLHPLIHTLLAFNLAQNAVGDQVIAIEKVTPISLGHQIRPMGVVKGFCQRIGAMILVCKSDANEKAEPFMTLS